MNKEEVKDKIVKFKDTEKLMGGNEKQKNNSNVAVNNMNNNAKMADNE